MLTNCMPRLGFIHRILQFRLELKAKASKQEPRASNNFQRWAAVEPFTEFFDARGSQVGRVIM